MPHCLNMCPQNYHNHIQKKKCCFGFVSWEVVHDAQSTTSISLTKNYRQFRILLWGPHFETDSLKCCHCIVACSFDLIYYCCLHRYVDLFVETKFNDYHNHGKQINVESHSNLWCFCSSWFLNIITLSLLNVLQLMIRYQK